MFVVQTKRLLDVSRWRVPISDKCALPDPVRVALRTVRRGSAILTADSRYPPYPRHVLQNVKPDPFFKRQFTCSFVGFFLHQERSARALGNHAAENARADRVTGLASDRQTTIVPANQSCAAPNLGSTAHQGPHRRKLSARIASGRSRDFVMRVSAPRISIASRDAASGPSALIANT